MTIGATQCTLCRHFRREDSGSCICPAFPDGIPKAVLFDSIPHGSVISGQIGYTTFDPRPGARADQVEFIRAWHRGEVQNDEDNED